MPGMGASRVLTPSSFCEVTLVPTICRRNPRFQPGGCDAAGLRRRSLRFSCWEAPYSLSDKGAAVESDKLDNGQASSPEGRASETRLEEIRRTAELRGQAESTSLKAEARASAQTGYYGVPLLKPPPWKWEIPAYFFVGGMAGAAAVIAGAGSLAGADERLVRDARRLAALGGL